jgi:hypothetical protein
MKPAKISDRKIVILLFLLLMPLQAVQAAA